MKFIIFYKQDLRPVAVYEALAMDLGRVESNMELVHAPLPDGVDPSNYTIVETAPGVYSIS